MTEEELFCYYYAQTVRQPTGVAAASASAFDFEQTFEGALTAAGLAANDNSALLTDANWQQGSAPNADGRLTVGAGGAKTGSQGLIYDCTGSFDRGVVTVGFTGVDALSTGFWFRLPAGLIGSFTEHDLIRINDAVNDRQFLMKVFGNTATIDCAAFTDEEDYSTSFVLAAATWYWATVGWTRNSATGWKLRVYNEASALVGTEQTRISGDSPIIYMELGSVIGSGAHTGAMHFDRWVANWTTATFPILPPA